jgi:hypothetical protein
MPATCSAPAPLRFRAPSVARGALIPRSSLPYPAPLPLSASLSGSDDTPWPDDMTTAVCATSPARCVSGASSRMRPPWYARPPRGARPRVRRERPMVTTHACLNKGRSSASKERTAVRGAGSVTFETDSSWSVGARSAESVEWGEEERVGLVRG